MSKDKPNDQSASSLADNKSRAQPDQVSAPWTEKELRDWVWHWSQNEGKTPLESDINDLIWTIQKQSGRISSAQEPKDEVSPQQRAKQKILSGL